MVDWPLFYDQHTSFVSYSAFIVSRWSAHHPPRQPLQSFVKKHRSIITTHQYKHTHAGVCRQQVIHRTSHSILTLVSTILLWSRLLLSSPSSLMLQHTTKNSKSSHNIFLQQYQLQYATEDREKVLKQRPPPPPGSTLVWVALVWWRLVREQRGFTIKEQNRSMKLINTFPSPECITFPLICHRGTAREFECWNTFTLTHKTDHNLNQSTASAVS